MSFPSVTGSGVTLTHITPPTILHDRLAAAGMGNGLMQAQGFRQYQHIKALAFDVQGTCVDFYQPVLRAGAAVNRDKGLTIDWTTLLAEWLATSEAAKDRAAWVALDQSDNEPALFWA